MPSEGTHGPYSPCAHGATWPTYWIELLQPLGVQIVQGGKLSHGSHDAYFPSAPSLTTPSQPPPWPHQTAPTLPWARRTISAPLQTEVEQQHRCGGSMWSALQLHCTKKKKKKQKYTSGVWVLLKYCLTYIIKKVHRFLEQRYPKRGQCVFSCTVWDSEWIHDGSRICF